MPLEREADAIGHWMPSSVMAALLMVALVVIARAIAKRLDRQDEHLETIRDRLPTLATREMLGTMGDRFDARIAKLTDEQGSLRGRIESIERRER